MALVVEDGTGLPNAESYLSAADAGAYHTAMGNTAWSAEGVTDSDREAALRRATQYLDGRYRFRGEPLRTGQALSWPRTAADWPVPRLRDACAELALRALAGALYADRSGGEVVAETVGPVSVQYAPSGLAGQTRYTVVDDLLRPLTTGGAGTLRLERAA